MISARPRIVRRTQAKLPRSREVRATGRARWRRSPSVRGWLGLVDAAGRRCRPAKLPPSSALMLGCLPEGRPIGSPGPLRLRARALRFRGVKLLREPLVQFLVIGAMLFAAHAAFKTREAEEAAGSSPVIQITAADADWLKEMWARQWRRAPTDEELIGLVADHLRRKCSPVRRASCNSMLATPSSAGGWRRRWRSCWKTRSGLRAAGSGTAGPLRCTPGPRRHACARLL